MASILQCFSGLLFNNHVIKRNLTEQSSSPTFVTVVTCPQISRTLPVSLTLKYLLEAAAWAESLRLCESPHVAQTPGPELRKCCCPRWLVVFWDCGWSITFRSMYFMATDRFTRSLQGHLGEEELWVGWCSSEYSDMIRRTEKWRDWQDDCMGARKRKFLHQYLSPWAEVSKEVLESLLREVCKSRKYSVVQGVLGGRDCSTWGWV